jgi:hypothetical protein
MLAGQNGRMLAGQTSKISSDRNSILLAQPIEYFIIGPPHI